MPGSELPAGGDARDQTVTTALDHFCSASEQTYAQFVASFTQLDTATLRPGNEPRTTSGAIVVETRPSNACGGSNNGRGQEDLCDSTAELQLTENLDKTTSSKGSNQDDVPVLPMLPGEADNMEPGPHLHQHCISSQLEFPSFVTADSAPVRSSLLGSGVHVSGVRHMGAAAPDTDSSDVDQAIDEIAVDKPTWSTVSVDKLQGSGDMDTPKDRANVVDTPRCNSSSVETSFDGVEVNTPTGNNDVDSPKTATSDQMVQWEEVQPFQLDEDFDYDHVVLTPKFSPSWRTHTMP